MATTTGLVYFLRNNPYSYTDAANKGVNRDGVSFTGATIGNAANSGETSSSVLVDGTTSTFFNGSTAFAALALDPSAQKYFFVNEQYVTTSASGGSNVRPAIFSASTASGAVTPTPLYSAPIPLSGSLDYGSINDLAIDQANRRIYFTQSYVTSVVDTPNGRFGKPDPTRSGLFYVNETGGAAVQVSAANALSSPTVMALDLADGIAFVADATGTALDGGQANGNVPVNRLCAVNLATGAVQVLFSYAYHPDQAFGTDYYGGNVLDGLAVDAATHTLYYTVNNIYDVLANDSFADTQDGIYKASFAVSNGNVTLGATTTLYSGANAFDASRIEIDTQNGVFYVVGNTQKPDASLQGTGPYDEAIYAGSLTATNTTALIRVTPNSETRGTQTGDTSDPHGAYFGTANQEPFYADNASIGFDAVPLLTAGSTVAYAAGAAGTKTAAALTAGSSTSLYFISATVTLAGYRVGDLLTAGTTGTSVTMSYNAGTGVLALSGTDTVANYQSVLRTVTYSSSAADPTGAGASTSRTLTYTVNDGVATGSATSTVTEQTAPQLNAGSPSVTFTGGGGAVAADPVLSVVDYTSANLAGATVKVSSGFVSGDTLGFGSQNGITGSFNTATGVLTLAGAATVAQYQAALRSVTFGFAAGGNPTAGNSTSRTLSYTATDGGLTSATVFSTVSVVHAPPTVSAGSGVTFVRGNGAVAVAPSASVGTPDSNGMLASATVSITGGFAAGDTLGATGANGITAAFNPATGVLSLSGTATAAQYQAVLDGVAFSAGNAAATGTRTLTFVVNDGTANSAAASSTVAVVAPTPSIGGTAANQAVSDTATVSPFGTVTITDAAAETETATLGVKAGGTASDANGLLSGPGLTKTGVGTYTLSAQTPAALTSLLRGLVFTPTAHEVAPGSSVSTGFSIAVADAGGGTASDATTSVVATAATSTPVIRGAVSGQATTDLVPVQPFSGVTIDDPDFGVTPTVTITLRSGGGATDANGTLSGTGLSHTGVGTYTLAAASPATLTNEIRALTFTPTRDQVPLGQSVSTTFGILAAFGGASATDTMTSVQATEVPCFAAGTLIRTGRGAVAVEALAVGDRVLTASGTLRPVKWLGHRVVDCARHPDPAAVMPVRIDAGAFGPGLPEHDLWVSPGHAVCAPGEDGVLIPAHALCNGATVRQVDVARITYWHVELDSHDILLANGLPAESYMDVGNRRFFAEADAVDLHAGPDGVAGSLADYCRPFVEAGPLVEVARNHLRARAVALGWVQASAPLGGAHLLVAGRRVDPAVDGAILHFTLPRDAGPVWLVSDATVLHDVAASGDLRRLGLDIRAIRVEGAGAVALDDPLLCAGWHGLEDAGGTPHRWTSGRTLLPAALWQGCAGPLMLRIDLAGPVVAGWQGPVVERMRAA